MGVEPASVRAFDMHRSLDEFEIRSDSTTDYGVSCHWASKNPIVL